MNAAEEYARYLRLAPEEADALAAMSEEEREDAFYRSLTFGTAGLRGVMGPGTNRMNPRVVARASRGLAAWLRETGAETAVIGYDSRHHSREYAAVAAAALAERGIRVLLFGTLIPTPCVSFAVRETHAGAGVMITASHNPPEYNGYKVYGPDGGQITDAAADRIQAAIDREDLFAPLPDEAEAAGRIAPVPDSLTEDYLRRVLSCVPAASDPSPTIVYSPLNGTGRGPVLRALAAAGFGNVRVVPEQEQPDGDFPTCPKPNPEERTAMEPGIRLAEETGAGLVIATDPDCDRLGAAVRQNGAFRLLTGNELGALLLDWLCARREAAGTLPAKAVAVRSLVSTDLADDIAAAHGVEMRQVLTGFKYIGEQMTALEAEGREEDFLFGFEESCGFLSGTHARDKDGVNAALAVCAMYADYHAAGLTLTDRLEALQDAYGRRTHRTISRSFPGEEGAREMAALMARLRAAPPEVLCGAPVTECRDYVPGREGLPPADMLELLLADGGRVILRPSGTEPKLKLYLTVRAAGPEAEERIRALEAALL